MPRALNKIPFLFLAEERRGVCADLPEDMLTEVPLCSDIVCAAHLTCQEEKKDAGLRRLGFAGLCPPM